MARGALLVSLVTIVGCDSPCSVDRSHFVGSDCRPGDKECLNPQPELPFCGGVDPQPSLPIGDSGTDGDTGSDSGAGGAGSEGSAMEGGAAHRVTK
jgi:hypothetical protein